MPDDKWYTVARFVKRDNAQDVYFVKCRSISHPEWHLLTCTCDGYAANVANGVSHCKHTDFCRQHVLDDSNGVLIDKYPPAKVASDTKVLDLWMDRHIKQFVID